MGGLLEKTTVLKQFLTIFKQFVTVNSDNFSYYYHYSILEISFFIFGLIFGFSGSLDE